MHYLFAHSYVPCCVDLLTNIVSLWHGVLIVCMIDFFWLIINSRIRRSWVDGDKKRRVVGKWVNDIDVCNGSHDGIST